MRIAVGSDHAGFALKEHVRAALAAAGHDVVDVGTTSDESVDYPGFAADAARLVAAGEADRAVLACGSGNGVAIVANKVAGIRAVNAHDADEAEMARRHNDINVVTLSGAAARAGGGRRHRRGASWPPRPRAAGTPAGSARSTTWSAADGPAAAGATVARQ